MGVSKPLSSVRGRNHGHPCNRSKTVSHRRSPPIHRTVHVRAEAEGIRRAVGFGRTPSADAVALTGAPKASLSEAKRDGIPGPLPGVYQLASQERSFRTQRPPGSGLRCAVVPIVIGCSTSPGVIDDVPKEGRTRSQSTPPVRSHVLGRPRALSPSASPQVPCPNHQ